MDRLKEAIMDDNLEDVKSLVVDPTVDKNLAIQLAANYGQLNIVKFLVTLPGVDPTIYSNNVVRLAAQSGHIDVVKFLVTLPGVDPTILDNITIQYAAVCGHLEVVKFLVTLPGVDPAANGNHAIKWAALNGHLEFVKYLLTFPGVDPTADDNQAIQWATEDTNLCPNGYSEHFGCIINIYMATHSFFKKAEKLEVVKFLITLPGVLTHNCMVPHDIKMKSFLSTNCRESKYYNVKTPKVELLSSGLNVVIYEYI